MLKPFAVKCSVALLILGTAAAGTGNVPYGLEWLPPL